MNLHKIKKIFKKRLVAELTTAMRDGILDNYDVLREEIQVIKQRPTLVVYEVNGSTVLKITHSTFNSYETLHAIALWQDDMSKYVKEVIPLIPSKHGQVAVKIDHGNGYFTAVLSHRAKGEEFRQKNWNPDVVFKVGALTGKLHNASRKISHLEPYRKIRDWHEIAINEFLQYLPQKDHFLLDRFHLLLNEILKVPFTNENYGIIHGDIYLGNLMINNGELSIYDFDDACKSWFIGDVANIVHTSMLNDRKNLANNKDYVQHFMDCFWKGYNLHNTIDKQMINYLHLSISLRAIFMYAFFCKEGYNKSLYPPTMEYVKYIGDLARHEWENQDSKILFDSIH